MVEAEGDEAVSRRKEFNDVDQANDLTIIVGIGRELIMFFFDQKNCGGGPHSIEIFINWKRAGVLQVH